MKNMQFNPNPVNLSLRLSESHAVNKGLKTRCQNESDSFLTGLRLGDFKLN